MFGCGRLMCLASPTARSATPGCTRRALFPQQSQVKAQGLIGGYSALLEKVNGPGRCQRLSMRRRRFIGLGNCHTALSTTCPPRLGYQTMRKVPLDDLVA